MNLVKTKSIEYACWHEVGHVLAAYVNGGTVDRVIIRNLPEGKRHPFAQCNYESSFARQVACGGLAMEWILFEKSAIVDVDGNALSSTEFDESLRVNCSGDQESLLKEHPNLGVYRSWNLFRDFGIRIVAPSLEPFLTAARLMVTASMERGCLSREEIERYLGNGSIE